MSGRSACSISTSEESLLADSWLVLAHLAVWAGEGLQDSGFLETTTWQWWHNNVMCLCTSSEVQSLGAGLRNLSNLSMLL